MAKAAFLFGKLPAHGDFLSRGLGEAARQAWDDWSSGALEDWRGRTVDFEASHDAALPWRFVLGPSALGPGWRCGAVAPSVDGAGRRYLLALGLDGLDGREAVAIGQTLAQQAEVLIYRAIGERLTADEAIEAMQAEALTLAEQEGLAMALAAEPAGPGGWWAEGSGLPLRAQAAPPMDLFVLADGGARENAA